MTQRPSAMQNGDLFERPSAMHNLAHGRFTYDRREDAIPSLLLIGDDSLQHWVRGRNIRFLGAVSHEDAPEMVSRIVRVDVVIVDCARIGRNAGSLAQALSALPPDVAVIAVSQLETLDTDFAVFGLESSVQWLCDPEPADFEKALAIALQPFVVPDVLHDSGTDRTQLQRQLQHLSEEVERLSRTLNALHPSNGTTSSRRSAADDPGDIRLRESLPREAETTLTAAIMRDILRARRQRDYIFGHDLFADPAWDMILDLMAARLARERVSVSSLCIAAAVPPTTALRWIRHLTQRGLFERRPDTQDGRRVFIALSDKAAAAVHRWYAANFPLR